MLIIAVIAFTFCSNITGENQVPYGWKQIHADGKFSFYLPRDMRDTGVSGMENYHKEYTNGKLHVSFDYDPIEVIAYPVRPGALGKNHKEISLEIDGRKAFMFLYETTDWRKRPYYFADLSVGDIPNRDVKLRMWIATWNPANLKIAETIFHSIRFKSNALNEETKEPVVQTVNHELLELKERSEVVEILRQRLASRSRKKGRPAENFFNEFFGASTSD